MSVGSKRFLALRGPKRITPVDAAERRTGYAVLILLLAVLAFVLTEQSRFNPAVVAALRQGPPGQKRASGGVASELAQVLDALPGVTPVSEVEVFGADTLSDKIDGKAELYLSSGFKEMAWRAFAPTGEAKARFDVYIYDMDSSPSAFAVFSGQRRSGSDPSGLSENAYLTGNALFFTVGARYLEVVADSDAPAVKGLLEPLGASLMAKLSPKLGGQARAGEPGQLEPGRLFPGQGMTSGSLRLAKSDAFGLEGFSDVYTADYQQGGEATGFVSVLPDAPQALQWKQNYLKFLLDNGYRASGDARDFPEGAAVFELDGAFEAVLTRGRVLYGVHEATSRQAALILATELEKRIREILR